MLNRYKVKLIKKYEFELNDKTKKGIQEQVNYIISQTKLLEMPYVRKDIKLKIRKLKRRKKK